MPSPFPGMDPYLEDPEFFPGLHFRLTISISSALQTTLPMGYYAELGPNSCFVEIRTVRQDRPVVTVIEVLEPLSTLSDEWREQYLLARRKLLDNQVNLIEIGLLRGENPSTTFSKEAAALAGKFDYHVSVLRIGQPRRCYFYPIALEAPLPLIGVPLSPGDSDVGLDLQVLFADCYHQGPYHVYSPYLAHQPDPPLTPEQAAWATKILRNKSLLPAE